MLAKSCDARSWMTYHLIIMGFKRGGLAGAGANAWWLLYNTEASLSRSLSLCDLMEDGRRGENCVLVPTLVGVHVIGVVVLVLRLAVAEAELVFLALGPGRHCLSRHQHVFGTLVSLIERHPMTWRVISVRPCLARLGRRRHVVAVRLVQLRQLGRLPQPGPSMTFPVHGGQGESLVPPYARGSITLTLYFSVQLPPPLWYRVPRERERERRFRVYTEAPGFRPGPRTECHGI